MVLESTQRILVVHRERPLSVIDSERLSVPIAIDQVSFDISILEQLENCYDLLVLDWHLEQPDARGVLDAFRQTAPESWVLALAAEVPDDDPVDRGVDEVLVEPVAPTALAGTLERLLFQCAYERTMHNLFRLSTERAVLETELESDVAVGDQYQSVVQELQTCRERAASIRAELSGDSFDQTLRQLFSE
ncbi:HalX domain-containing protein [Natronolimnobius baerhuensis]|uniref:Response regulator receiver protein n=1 Tax=Natronolimnobius baerhuensis TaxID=253108 RepID=A0A202E6C1_9EURY|nr:HalX domain-containing protein [Natronolimnobius baerhuensis]OVE83795.1 response regulator receiver protein [Natronolimnobius baerhuensis]